MKKTVLFIALSLLPCISRADEYSGVQKILSKDSTVWILVCKNGNLDTILYKINFCNMYKIDWIKEHDYTDFHSLNNENEKILKRTLSILDSLDNVDNTKSKRPGPLDNNWWSIESEWSTIESRSNKFLCYRHSATWKSKVCQLPNNNSFSTLHAELHDENRTKVWVGGSFFVGYYYYYYGVFTRLFLIDEYELQDIAIEIAEECFDVEIEKEPNPEDYDNPKDYEYALEDYHGVRGGACGDDYPESICFCDGRKIGYIKDSDGFVNFRTAPDISAPIIGIILDRVRVFYWDNENNGDWYRVEINGIEGYVQKSKVIIKNEENV